MQSDSEKLKSVRSSYNLTQKELADKLNMKQSVIAMIESGKRGIPASFKLAFVKAFGVDWDTNIADSTTFKIEHLEYPSHKNNSIGIPLYSAKAAAGVGMTLPDYPEKDVIYFDRRWLKAVVGHNPKNLSLIQATGDSMQPDIQDGDLLLIDDSIQDIIPNKTFVISQDNNLRVKKLKTDINGDILIISNNPSYPIEIMNKETMIVGQVVWNGNRGNI